MLLFSRFWFYFIFIFSLFHFHQRDSSVCKADTHCPATHIHAREMLTQRRQHCSYDRAWVSSSLHCVFVSVGHISSASPPQHAMQRCRRIESKNARVAVIFEGVFFSFTCLYIDWVWWATWGMHCICMKMSWVPRSLTRYGRFEIGHEQSKCIS